MTMLVFVIIPYKIAAMGYMASQVIAQFKYLVSVDYDVTLISVADQNKDTQISFEQELELIGIKSFFVKDRNYLFKGYLTLILFSLYLSIRHKPRAVYTREIWGAQIAILLQRLSLRKKTIFVYDIRGAVPEEMIFSQPKYEGTIRNKLFSFMEKRAIRNATCINAVTKELSDHIYNKYCRNSDTIIPCCVEKLPVYDDNAISLQRSILGFDLNDTVYVYSGGLSRWQLFEETIDLFYKISQIDATAKLLVLTSDVMRASQLMAAKLPNELYYITSVDPKSVTSFIQVGDIGLLLRENNIVNKVAFPIKFGEYLAAGLPVISTKALPSVAHIITSENLGLLISVYEEDVRTVADWANGVTASRQEWRSRCRTYVSKKLTWEAYLQSFAKLYHSPHQSNKTDSSGNC